MDNKSYFAFVCKQNDDSVVVKLGYDSAWSDSDLVRIVRQFLWESKDVSWSIQNYDKWRIGHESQMPSTGSLRNRLGTWSEIRVLALEADLPDFDMSIFDSLEVKNA